MKIQRIRFMTIEQAALVEDDLDESPGDREVLVRTLYSVVSAGTEGSHYTGLEEEHPGRAANLTYPRNTGYGNLGEVVRTGAKVTEVKPGDRILSFANHATHVKWNLDRFCVKVPDGADLKQAVFTRMAGVAITALRSSSVTAGNVVVVIGLGLVGNFAAQLFQIAGAEVIGSDVAQRRLDLAAACGIRRAVNPKAADLKQTVMEATGGKGADVVVEAIGRADLIAQSVDLLRRHGEIVLLGSPRARHTMDITPMLSRIHLQGLRMIGALEWLFSTPEHDAVKVSVTRNCRDVVRWIGEGRLKTDPLLTHLLSPAQCQEAYHGLAHRKDEYVGVVFDWSKVS